MLTTDFAQSAQTPLPEIWLKIREIQGLIKGINDFELRSVGLFRECGKVPYLHCQQRPEHHLH